MFERAEKERDEVLVEDGAVGLWQGAGKLSWSDVMAAPCMSRLPIDLSTRILCDVNADSRLILLRTGLFRASNVLKHYRGFSLPEGPKFDAYIKRLFEHPVVKSTCSTEELYLDSYERFVPTCSHRAQYTIGETYRQLWNAGTLTIGRTPVKWRTQ